MAFRLAFKINRILLQNKSKFLVHDIHHFKPFSNHGSKPTFIVHPTKQVKSASTYSQRKWNGSKIDAGSAVPLSMPKTTVQQTVAVERPHKSKATSLDEQEMSDLQPAAMRKYFTPRMTSNSVPFPEKTTMNRKFSKSSTQSALTMPLKLPRLANPFPEPVKTLPSHTISDEEKAMLMQEEMRMESRFRLQQQQEALHHQQFQQPQQQQPQMMTKVSFQQPQYRRPQLHLEEQQSVEEGPMEASDNGAQLMQERRVGGARGRAGRRHRTRAARYLHNPRHPRIRTMQERRYSSDATVLHPTPQSTVELCKTTLEHLRTQFPEEYNALKKPLLVPGSLAEKEFVQATLKLIAKHRAGLQRRPAPFPSYSEVKTFVREPVEGRTAFRPPANTRAFGTKRSSSDREDICAMKKKEKKKPTCARMNSPGCKEPRPTRCEYVIGESTCKKQEAPYPSYSECMDDPVEDEFSECKACPTRIRHAEIYGGYVKDKSSSGKKHYSTASGMTPTDMEAQPKKKKPCENPNKDIHPCDYEKTAQKRLEKKRNRRSNSPSSTNKSKTKKSMSAVATSARETNTVIETIRGWLSSWRPDADNIKISRADEEAEGRETYIIEIREQEDAPCDTHAVEMFPRAPVMVHHIPGLVLADSSSSGGCMKTPGGCPPKKKQKKEEEKKKKCRTLKKRKLPNCDDAMKNKKDKKKSLELPIPGIEDTPRPGATASAFSHGTAAPVRRQSVINIKAQDYPVPKKSEVSPQSTEGHFKLKPQFWKTNSK